MKRARHPSGMDIIFDSKWHQYKIGHTSLSPVTKLLDKHFPFDEKRILSVVSRKTGQTVEEIKANWTRQALLGKNIHEYIETKLSGRPPPTWTLLLPSRQAGGGEKENIYLEDEGGKGGEANKTQSPVANNNKKKKTNKNKKEENEKNNKNGEEMMSLKQSAANAMLHGEEEIYMRAADDVVNKILNNYEMIAVEQLIASPSWGVGGTIDFIARNKRTNKLLIGDWKTSGSVMSSSFRFGYFESPCTGCLLHLPNNKFYRYAMQVIIYGEILKHENYLLDGFFGDTIKPINGNIKKICVEKCDVDEIFEYGIVQMLKSEEGRVCVEFNNVTESTVLPVDASDVTFIELLKNVMRG